jgi:hypothetical protein
LRGLCSNVLEIFARL